MTAVRNAYHVIIPKRVHVTQTQYPLAYEVLNNVACCFHAPYPQAEIKNIHPRYGVRVEIPETQSPIPSQSRP